MRIAFDALCSAHQPFFLLDKRKKEGKEKDPDDLPLAIARSSLRFSPFPARVNCLGPSMVLALRAPQAATTGLLAGLSLPAVGQTRTRFSRKRL
ncbi:MAG: hypothetical protein WBN02_11000 [Sedimenticolaceae bacterium]|jgi:hypothetical protein